MLKMFLIIRINILYINRPESPIKFFLRTAIARHIDSQEELLEVNETILITVEGPEDMITELLGIASREALAVHLAKGGRSQLACWAVRYEALVVTCDCGLVIGCLCEEKVQVLPGQNTMRRLCAHG